MCLCMDGVTQEEHDKNLLPVLNRIQEAAGLTLNKKKCVFSKESSKYVFGPTGMESSLTQTRLYVGINNMLQPREGC